MKRKKILLIIKDYFLKEIIGNLLHKQGYFIINNNKNNNEIKEKNIDILIYETSKNKENIENEINKIIKDFKTKNIFILNGTNKILNNIDINMQINISNLSIQKILNKINTM